MARIKLKPLHDCLIIDPEPTKDYTDLMGYKEVVLPEHLKYGPINQPIFGLVIARGPECKNPDIRLGTRVMIAKFGWEKIMAGPDKHYCLVREYDVLAITVE